MSSYCISLKLKGDVRAGADGEGMDFSSKAGGQGRGTLSN